MIKRVITIINIVFAAVLIYLGVIAFDQITAVKKQGKPRTPVRSEADGPMPGETYRPLPHYAPISDRNLFETSQKGVPVKPQIDIESLKETDLKLKLLGTVTAGTGRAYAVIEDLKTRRQELHAVDDKIQGATIKQILRGNVVLNYNGKDSVLKMDMKDRNSLSRPYSPPKRSDLPRAGENIQRISLPRSMIDRSLKDYNQMQEQLKVKPYLNAGIPEGVQISSIRRRSLFSRMGLRNGDVLTTVNGNGMNADSDTLVLYEALKSSSSISVQIKRRGKLKTIEYTIR